MKNFLILALILTFSISSSCTKEEETCKTCVGVIKRKLQDTDNVYATSYITNEFCDDELQYVMDNPYKKVIEELPIINLVDTVWVIDTVWTVYTCE